MIAYVDQSRELDGTSIVSSPPLTCQTLFFGKREMNSRAYLASFGSPIRSVPASGVS